MTAETKKSTAIATSEKRSTFLETLLSMAQTPEERERAFTLAEAHAKNKMLAELSAEVAATSWGEKLSPVLRQQIVRYALEIGADPTRHLFVLGGRPYLNAAFYQELIVQDPDYLRAEVEFVHDDDRADDAERSHRRAVRIAYGVPEKVLGAAVVTLHFKNNRGPFVGVKWAPSTKTDPVGLEYPTLAAETRAWRKAAQKAVSPWFLQHPILAKLDALAKREVVGELEPMPVTTEPVAIAALSEGAVASMAAQPDPYTGEQPKSKMTSHNPNARCTLEGPHEVTSCGMAKP